MRALWCCVCLSLLVGCATSGDRGDVAIPASKQMASGEGKTRAKSHADLGAGYYETRQFSTALDEARIAIAADAAYAPAYNLLALVYVELKENRAANEAFERALQLAPGDPEISNNYGWFLCQVGQQAKGLQFLQKAIGNPLYVTPAVALTNSAVCALGTSDMAAAEEFLARALRFDPNHQRAMFMLAELQYRMGRFAEAQLRIGELHRRFDPSAESSWLALRIARKVGNRGEEARFGALLRQRFMASVEYQKLSLGQYE